MSSLQTPIASPLDFAPAFATLERSQCENVLTRNLVGRLAFSMHDRVSILPVHYVYNDGWIYGRTSPGGKLLDIIRNRLVAFEVDEHEGVFTWRSVVVHGPLYLIDPERSAKEKENFEYALRMVRTILPTTMGSADPVPFRNEIFRIQVSEISGRSSSLGGRKMPGVAERMADPTSNPELDALIAQRARETIAKICGSDGHVHADVFDEVLVLSGWVATAEDRTELEAAVLAIPEVVALVQQLEATESAQMHHRTPYEIARQALLELRLGPPLADAEIKIVVENGWLRAEGSATTGAARNEALRRLRSVHTRGVIDRVRLWRATEKGEEVPYEKNGIG